RECPGQEFLWIKMSKQESPKSDLQLALFGPLEPAGAVGASGELPMGKVLHAPPGGDDRGVVDVFHQKVAKSFGEIQIFFGTEIEAFDRLLAKRRCILHIPLVHFEHCAIDRGHLPAPIDHFVHILIDHLHGLSGVRHGIRPFLNHPEDRDVSIDYPGVIFADISEETAPAYEQYQECQ
ncbi:MAG TPA: hypothetical protein VI114_13170, partial [Chthoniobacterales bacterium]